MNNSQKKEEFNMKKSFVAALLCGALTVAAVPAVPVMDL